MLSQISPSSDLSSRYITPQFVPTSQTAGALYLIQMLFEHKFLVKFTGRELAALSANVQMCTGCAFNSFKEELMSYPMSSIESELDLGLKTLSYDCHMKGSSGKPFGFQERQPLVRKKSLQRCKGVLGGYR